MQVIAGGMREGSGGDWLAQQQGIYALVKHWRCVEHGGDYNEDCHCTESIFCYKSLHIIFPVFISIALVYTLQV
jgi:hypothetical protein